MFTLGSRIDCDQLLLSIARHCGSATNCASKRASCYQGRRLAAIPIAGLGAVVVLYRTQENAPAMMSLGLLAAELRFIMAED
jgi:hypothetical protein